MSYIEKKVQINNNRILKYQIIKDSIIPNYIIEELFIDNDTLEKSYKLHKWDDYGFRGWIEDEKTTRLSFDFDYNHPLFMPLFHLLNYDNELIIEDDNTRENNLNYLKIYLNKNKIYIDFIDEAEDNTLIQEHFYIFIKNICIDGRSKIDREYKDTKERLLVFFKEVYQIFKYEYSQISIEEYLLPNSSKEEYLQLKKEYKRKY